MAKPNKGVGVITFYPLTGGLPPRYREFNGKRYTLFDVVRSESFGHAKCKTLRSKGHLARLVELGNSKGYAIYWRK